MNQGESYNRGRSDIDNLLDDIEYLVYELDALKTVIEGVEYNDQLPGSNQLSILDKLRSLGYVQEGYYKYIIGKVVDEEESEINLKREKVYEKFLERLSHEEEEKHQDIEEVLVEVISEREELLSRLKEFSIPLWNRDFERHDSEEDKKITLYTLLNEMVSFERNELKDIAERIQIMSIDREQQRQMRAQNK